MPSKDSMGEPYPLPYPMVDSGLSLPESMVSFAPWTLPLLQKDVDTRGDILSDFLAPGVHAILLIHHERMMALPFVDRLNMIWIQHVDGWLPANREDVMKFIQDDKATEATYTLSVEAAQKIMAQPPQA